ncbi:MAG: hypothetical protein ACRC0S_02220 [Fusobacteriaceae bacterium]
MSNSWQNKYLLDHEFIDYLHDCKIRYCYTSHEFRNKNSEIIGSIDIDNYYKTFEVVKI